MWNPTRPPSSIGTEKFSAANTKINRNVAAVDRPDQRQRRVDRGPQRPGADQIGRLFQAAVDRLQRGIERHEGERRVVQHEDQRDAAE